MGYGDGAFMAQISGTVIVQTGGTVISKWVIVFGRYTWKTLSTLSSHRMTTGFGPFEHPTRGLLQKGWDYFLPNKACFEESSSWLAFTVSMIQQYYIVWLLYFFSDPPVHHPLSFIDCPTSFLMLYISHSDNVSQKLHNMVGDKVEEPSSPLTESKVTYNT